MTMNDVSFNYWPKLNEPRDGKFLREQGPEDPRRSRMEENGTETVLTTDSKK